MLAKMEDINRRAVILGAAASLAVLSTMSFLADGSFGDISTGDEGLDVRDVRLSYQDPLTATRELTSVSAPSRTAPGRSERIDRDHSARANGPGRDRDGGGGGANGPGTEEPGGGDTGGAGDTIHDTVGGVTGGVDGTVGGVTDTIDNTVDDVTDVVGGGDGVDDVVDDTTDVVDGTVDDVTDTVDDVTGGLGDTVDDVTGGLPGLGGN
jgi:hypothetical protein